MAFRERAGPAAFGQGLCTRAVNPNARGDLGHNDDTLLRAFRRLPKAYNPSSLVLLLPRFSAGFNCPTRFCAVE